MSRWGEICERCRCRHGAKNNARDQVSLSDIIAGIVSKMQAERSCFMKQEQRSMFTPFLPRNHHNKPWLSLNRASDNPCPCIVAARGLERPRIPFPWVQNKKAINLLTAVLLTRPCLVCDERVLSQLALQFIWYKLESALDSQLISQFRRKRQQAGTGI